MKRNIGKEIKRRIAEILVTTALAIIGLSIVAVICHGRYLCVDTIFQIVFVNVLIHLGLWLFQNLECSYFYVEILGDLGIVLVILLPAGYLFSWFESISPFLLGVLGMVVYGVACLIEVIQIQNNLKKINRLLN